MKTNATIEQLNKALVFVNAKFDNNIRIKSIEQKTSKSVSFTLTVNDSKKPGGRIGHTGRHVAAACWHVHGYFFEYLFNNYDHIKVIAGTKKMLSNADNWQDWNIGSQVHPIYYSEACECN